LTIPWALTRRRVRGETGQVLVIFALSLVMLMAVAGLAFDIGRFYGERRFLQNTADAGALAIANALTRGETEAAAEAEGRDVLARNFLGSPNGSSPAAATTPVYESGYAGDPSRLLSGILINGSEVRVAVQSDVGYTFGRVIGLGSNTIGGHSQVNTNGDLLPIVVRHFINAPGPYAGALYPCAGDDNQFQDFISTADTACLGSETNGSLRTAASPTSPGPEMTLVGQGAAPSNNASFRGFVALDIRNFASATSNVFYNGVTAGTNANTLKALQAAYVGTGYPGPAFPPATAPPDPNDQIAIIDGNSSGIIIDEVGDRYVAGDEILAAVYSGTVMTIPDFTYTVASTVTIGTSQTRNNAITMTVTKNNAFTGVVTSSVVPDWGDLLNPYGTTLRPITFGPNPATPNTTITWTTFQTIAAPTGIWPLWVKGASSSPYLTDHYYPVAVNIGGVLRDFSSSGSGLVLATASTGGTATGSMTFSTPNNLSTYFGGTVSLTIEGGPQANGVLPIGLGTTSVSPSSFTLNRGASQAVSLSVNAGTLGPGEYPLTLRATGLNLAGQKVTRLIPFVLDVATAGTSSEYVDILGFAVFRITAVNSNSVDGYAISGVYADMNDPALRRGQTARLVPWD